MLTEHRVDLHVHTCLSPCADAAMIPPVIVARARERGLGVIGVCDHNTGENARPVREAAEGNPAVLCGMEVNTREEVHILALFEDPAVLEVLQELVYRHLEGRNRADLFGEQYRVDPEGHVLAINRRLLIGAADLSVNRVVREVHRLGGLAVASHVDRPSYSVISQLGTIPPGLAFDALEIAGPDPGDRLHRQWLGLGHLGPGGREAGRPPASRSPAPLVCFSDAHREQDIGSRSTDLLLADTGLEEIRLALRGFAGRRVLRRNRGG